MTVNLNQLLSPLHMYCFKKPESVLLSSPCLIFLKSRLSCSYLASAMLNEHEVVKETAGVGPSCSGKKLKNEEVLRTGALEQ